MSIDLHAGMHPFLFSPALSAASLLSRQPLRETATPPDFTIGFPGVMDYFLVLLCVALLFLVLVWGRRYRNAHLSGLMSQRILERMPDAVLLVTKGNLLLKLNRIPCAVPRNPGKEYIGKPLSALPWVNQELNELLHLLVERSSPSLPEETRRLHLSVGTEQERHVTVQSVYVHERGRDPAAVLLMISDTTTLEIAQRKSIEVEHRHAAIIEQLPAITYTLTLSESAPRTTFISPQIQTLLGFRAEDWIKDPNLWGGQIHPDDRESILRKRDQCHKALEPFDFVYRLYARDGRALWIQDRAVYLRSAETGQTLAHGVMLDITARKEAEAALEESEQRELQLLKMEALGRLAGGISHDMNNLLTPILGFSRLVRDAPDLPAGCREDLDEVIRAAERGSELTRQLLAFGRKQPVQLAPTNINRVITEMEPMLVRTIGENISLQIQLCDSPWMVQANAALLEQVIMNLAVNARDAMPNGGTLRLETANGTLDPDGYAQIPGAEYRDFLHLIVRDTGHGMAEEVRRHLFEPFFTTKAKGCGTGLGLSISYSVIKRFGGHISVDSEPGQGTAFHIYLPAMAGVQEPGHPAPIASGGSLPGGTETILIAEDEHGIRRLTVRILRGLGYHVLETTDGQDALDTIRRMNPPPDLLLTDVVMPRMGGPELARKVREDHPKLPVLFVTGFTPEDVLQSEMMDARSDLLLKPYSQRDLALHVRNLLNGKSRA